MTERKAWIILEPDGIASYDHKFPIFWIKKVAEKEAEELTIDGRVVRCVVRYEDDEVTHGN